jgi:hypothetical protein
MAAPSRRPQHEQAYSISLNSAPACAALATAVENNQF